MPEFRGAPHRRSPNSSTNLGPLHAGHLGKAAVTFRKRLRLAGFLSGAVLVIAPVAIELLFYSGSLSPEAPLVETLGILAAGGLLGGGAGYVVVEVFHWVWVSGVFQRNYVHDSLKRCPHA